MAVGRKNVLLVEDNRELRKALRELLEEQGYGIWEAADGRAAMNVLKEAAPDLVCLDLVLPESSGYELCEFIRGSEHHARTPVMIMSGRASATDRAFCAEAGADAFIAKPFAIDDFLGRINALLTDPAKG